MLKELEFPGSLVTITGVEVDKKLEAARVRLSILPQSSAKKALSIAEKYIGKLQYLLTKKMNIKPMPRIKFDIDYGAENASKIEKILLEEDNK
mgnify:FL=1